MTLEEKVIVSAYTGYLMCDFGEVHKYIEKLLGRPVWTHEIASPEIQKLIHDNSRNDFLKLCESEKKSIGFATDDVEETDKEEEQA